MLEIPITNNVYVGQKLLIKVGQLHNICDKFFMMY